MTEIVALQLFLTDVLSPVACGEQMSAEQYQELMRNVKTNKHRAAREVIAQYVAATTRKSVMTETNWGRKETIIWPPHSPIYTFGAIFLALVLTGLFVYLRFAFALTPLEQFYLPLYIKDLHRAEPSPLRQVPDAADVRRERPLLVCPRSGCRGGLDAASRMPSPSRLLSDSARQRGMIYLYRSAPTVYQKQRSVELPQAAGLRRSKHR